MTRTVDIVVVVRNHPDLALRCLDSVVRNTKHTHRIIVIDDGSDEFTAQTLKRWCETNNVVLRRHNEARGLEYATEKGIALSEPDRDVCWLAASAVVFPGWLGEMAKVLHGDEKRGWVSSPPIPMPPGTNAGYLARILLERQSKPIPGDVKPSDYCLLMRREALLDDDAANRCSERYYSEPDEKWESAICTSTYIFHPEMPDGNAELARDIGRFVEKKARERDQVAFVIKGLQRLGGCFDLMNLADALILQGVDANVVSVLPCGGQRKKLCAGRLFEPRGYPRGNAIEPLANAYAHLPRDIARGVLVAGTMGSVNIVNSACEKNPRLTPLAWCQDDEVRFWEDELQKARAERDAANVRRIEQSIHAISACYQLSPPTICVSKWVAEAYGRRTGRKPLATIPLGVDPLLFRPRKKAAKATVTGFARPKHARRGPDILRRLFTSLRRDLGDNVELVTIGHDLAMRQMVGNVCMVTDATPAKTAELVAQSHVVVDTSRYQGFGLPGVEAMASGTAFCCFRNGGVDEYGVHGENCLIVKPDDEKGLLDTVLGLLKNGPGDMIQKGRQTAERLSWNRIAARWIKAIRATRKPQAIETAPEPRVSIVRDRPKVLMAIPRLGWAFHNIALQTKKHLSDEFDIEITPYPEITGGNPDLTVAFWWRSRDIIRRRVRSGKMIVCLYDLFAPDEFISWQSNSEFKKIAHGCAGIVAGNEEIASVAREITKTPVHVCEDGVDLDMFPVLPLPASFRVGWVGNSKIANGQKGLNLIIEACKRAGAPLTQLASRSNSGTIQHEAMSAKFYKDFSCYVCASRVEGTPNPVLESLASGRPVVSTAVGLVPKIVDESCGVIVERNVDALMRGIQHVREIGPEKYAQAARQAVEKHSWAIKAEGWRIALRGALAW